MIEAFARAVGALAFFVLIGFVFFMASSAVGPLAAVIVAFFSLGALATVVLNG